MVIVGLLLGVAVGVLMTYSVTPGLPPTFENRQYEVGVASASVLVDSPSSQVADLGGGVGQTTVDVASLSARARLLANLMATSPLKDQIAARAGVPPDRLIARAPARIDLPGDKSPIGSGATISESDPLANILRINVNETLPILSADAQAPTPQSAAKISNAAVSQLRAYLKSIAAGDRVPDARKLVIKRLGPARYATVRKGPRRLFAVAAFLFVFGAWCAGIVVLSGLAQAWRQADEAELLEAAGAVPTPPASAVVGPPAAVGPAVAVPATSPSGPMAVPPPPEPAAPPATQALRSAAAPPMARSVKAVRRLRRPKRTKESGQSKADRVKYVA